MPTNLVVDDSHLQEDVSLFVAIDYDPAYNYKEQRCFATPQHAHICQR